MKENTFAFPCDLYSPIIMSLVFNISVLYITVTVKLPSFNLVLVLHCKDADSSLECVY